MVVGRVVVVGVIAVTTGALTEIGLVALIVVGVAQVVEAEGATVVVDKVVGAAATVVGVAQTTVVGDVGATLVITVLGEP